MPVLWIRRLCRGVSPTAGYLNFHNHISSRLPTAGHQRTHSSNGSGCFFLFSKNYKFFCFFFWPNILHYQKQPIQVWLAKHENLVPWHCDYRIRENDYVELEFSGPVEFSNLYFPVKQAVNVMGGFWENFIFSCLFSDNVWRLFFEADFRSTVFSSSPRSSLLVPLFTNRVWIGFKVHSWLAWWLSKFNFVLNDENSANGNAKGYGAPASSFSFDPYKNYDYNNSNNFNWSPSQAGKGVAPTSFDDSSHNETNNSPDHDSPTMDPETNKTNDHCARRTTETKQKAPAEEKRNLLPFDKERTRSKTIKETARANQSPNQDSYSKINQPEI